MDWGGGGGEGELSKAIMNHKKKTFLSSLLVIGFNHCGPGQNAAQLLLRRPYMQKSRGSCHDAIILHVNSHKTNYNENIDHSLQHTCIS